MYKFTRTNAHMYININICSSISHTNPCRDRHCDVYGRGVAGVELLDERAVVGQDV